MNNRVNSYLRDYDNISFTNDHVQQIRNGEKKSTLRTVKRSNLYPVGRVIQIEEEDDMYIKVVSRDVVFLTDDDIRAFDEKYETSPLPDKNDLAASEGFDTFQDLIDWFQGGNPFGVRYNLPQPFFFYRFEPMIE